jgi:hypothetical protein
MDPSLGKETKMKPGWMTMIQDPQSRPSAEQRRAALREMTDGLFGALVGRLVNKALEIPPPGTCPEPLAKRLAKHNERAADFLRRRAAWLERYISFPMREADSSVKPGQMIEEREAVLREQFEVFAEHRALVEARGGLLGEVLSTQREQEKASADALQHERSKTDRTLRKAGFAPEDNPRFNDNQETVRIQFSHKIEDAAPVRAARDVLAQAHLAVEVTETQIAGIAGDVALIGALKHAAMGEAVGSL